MDKLNARRVTSGRRQFWEAGYRDRPLVAALSGMGKVSAAMCAQQLIDLYRPHQLLVAGVAGALAADLEPGDLFLAEDICQYDVFKPGRGVEWEAYSHYGGALFNTDPALQAAARAIKWPQGSCYTGRLLTGDKAVANRDKARYLVDSLDGGAVDMETGAIAQVCAFNDVPLLSVRIISDKADSESMSAFRINFPMVCGALGDYLYLLLDKLIEEGIMLKE